MPAVSKKQFRFMKMMEHNPEKMVNKPEGLSRKEAADFVSSTKSYKDLPERAAPPVKKGRFKKVKSYLKGIK